jgi:hypothetical protein
VAFDSKALRAMTHGTRAAYVHEKCRCDACRTAEAEYQRSYRLANQDRLRQYDREPWRDTRLRDDPEKRRAREKARAYWRHRPRPACEVCGAESTHMHHDDYGRPYDVRFLCVRCHGHEHRRPNTRRLCGL